MNRPSARTLLLALLLLAVGALYLSGLDRQYLSIEEVAQAREALAVSRTGRGLGGDLLPVYFADASNEAGRFPIPIYVSAGLLKFAPFSEVLIRTPSALVGILDIVLMFMLARRIFAKDSLALVAAAFLAVTPAHFFHSRLAHQQIYFLPLVLAWLLCLVRYFDTGRPRDLFVATTCLGLGIYCYMAALVMVPVYLATTVIAVLRHHQIGVRAGSSGAPSLQKQLLMVCGGVSLALAPFVLWHATHSERLSQLIGYYTHNGYNLDLPYRSFLGTVITRLGIWWNAYNPNPLLFFGDSSLRTSTREVGYFLLPTAVFVAIGLFRLRGSLKPELRLLCAAGLVFGPLPIVLVSDGEIKRWLTVLPFVMLAATCGVKFALDSRRAAWRLGAIGLMLASLVQFGVFVHDYWGDYRGRSSIYYGGNLRGAIREVMATTEDSGCVFLHSRLQFVEPYWGLYTRTGGRDTLAQQARLVDFGDDDWVLPSRCQEASFVIQEDDQEFKKHVDQEHWKKTAIAEPDGKVLLLVYHYHAS